MAVPSTEGFNMDPEARPAWPCFFRSEKGGVQELPFSRVSNKGIKNAAPAAESVGGRVGSPVDRSQQTEGGQKCQLNLFPKSSGQYLQHRCYLWQVCCIPLRLFSTLMRMTRTATCIPESPSRPLVPTVAAPWGLNASGTKEVNQKAASQGT